MLLLLLACEPGEGEPGFSECQATDCDELFICYEIVGDRGEAEYWVEGPDAVRWSCDGADCVDALAWAECQVCGCA